MGAVSAIFGAAAGFAGLLLVFLGTAISAYQSYAADVPASVTARFRHAGAWILAAFLLALADVAVSFVWLLSPHRLLHDVAAVVFAVVLVATAFAAVTTSRALLWR